LLAGLIANNVAAIAFDLICDLKMLLAGFDAWLSWDLLYVLLHKACYGRRGS